MSYFCTDCGETFRSELVAGYRCSLCGGGRTLDPSKPHVHAAGTLVGKHIDECAICGQDLRCEIHISPWRQPASCTVTSHHLGPQGE